MESCSPNRQRVSVFLPRLKIDVSFGLSTTLKALGMQDAFSSRADFSGMDSKPLFISSVQHKAFVEVSEEGTEAVAVTAVVIGRSLGSGPPVFRADHPFLFLIRENHTGSVLFLGRMVEAAAGG